MIQPLETGAFCGGLEIRRCSFLFRAAHGKSSQRVDLPFSMRKSANLTRGPWFARVRAERQPSAFKHDEGRDRGFAQSTARTAEKDIGGSRIVKPQTESDFEAIFNSLPAPFLVMDRDFNIVAVNEAFLDATKCSRDVFIGTNICHGISGAGGKPQDLAILARTCTGLQVPAGPVFANVVLADEINRTPPKTQAALLEAMQERQVTVGGQAQSARRRRSSCWRRRTPSSRKAPTRCPRPSRTGSCSRSSSAIPATKRRLQIAELTACGHRARRGSRSRRCWAPARCSNLQDDRPAGAGGPARGRPRPGPGAADPATRTSRNGPSAA